MAATISGSGTSTLIDLTTSGNTILGDASTDTLNVGNGGLVKDASGNVGIGTASPLAKFEVRAGRSYFQANSEAYSIYMSYASGTAGFFIGSPSADAMSFSSSGGGERMRIDSSGNLLVGATSAYVSERIQARSASASTQCFTGYNPNNGQSGTNYYSSSVTAASTAWYHLICQAGNGTGVTTNNLFIFGNGNVQNTNNSYGPISDIKVKENITDATPKLAKLMQVRVVNYNLKGELGYETHKQIGVIAQELEQVFPGLVHETADKDVRGEDLGTTTKGVKMSVFVPILIKALQEQQALITQLQADVAALKGTA